MKIKEKPKKVTGVLTLDVYRNGVLISSDTGNNLVVDTGLDALNQAMLGISAKAVVDFQAGIDDTTPAPSNTGINTSKFDKPLDGATPGATGVITLHFSMGSTEGNGWTYNEWGLFCADGTLFAHKVATPIIKDTTITITGAWTITIS